MSGFGALAAGPIVENGVVYIQDLLTKGEGSFEIQPQIARRVYLASAYGLGPGGGVLVAPNASTGRRLWKFNTLLGPDQGVQAVGLGSAGAWETPLVGGDGSVTFGTGNPYQSAASAIADPSAQLYTDSDVNLEAATGNFELRCRSTARRRRLGSDPKPRSYVRA